MIYNRKSRLCGTRVGAYLCCWTALADPRVQTSGMDTFYKSFLTMGFDAYMGSPPIVRARRRKERKRKKKDQLGNGDFVCGGPGLWVRRPDSVVKGMRCLGI